MYNVLKYIQRLLSAYLMDLKMYRSGGGKSKLKEVYICW